MIDVVDFSYVMDLGTESKYNLRTRGLWNKCILFSCTLVRDVWSGLVLARVIVFIRCQTNKVKVIVYVDTVHRKEALKMSVRGIYSEKPYLIWIPPQIFMNFSEVHKSLRIDRSCKPHLKHLMAVMLLTRLARKAAVVVREVTSMDISACLRVALTRPSSLALLEPEPPFIRNSPCF